MVAVLDARSFRDPALPPVTDLSDPAQIGASLPPASTPPAPCSARLKFIHEQQLEYVVFISADIHGTLVNNLDFPTAPCAPPSATRSGEISTGAVAFDAPLGPTVVNLAAGAGLLSPVPQAFYQSLPVPAALEQGDDVTAHTYGWTEFDIDRATRALHRRRPRHRRPRHRRPHAGGRQPLQRRCAAGPRESAAASAASATTRLTTDGQRRHAPGWHHLQVGAAPAGREGSFRGRRQGRRRRRSASFGQ